MRMRRKKHLEERLEECSDYIFFMDREDKHFQTSVLKKEYIELQKIFGNSNPVHLEIGCGKGGFVCEIARRNPDINFLAVEKASNVIVKAAEDAKAAGLNNLYFMRGSAEYLECYIPVVHFPRKNTQAIGLRIIIFLKYTSL